MGERALTVSSAKGQRPEANQAGTRAAALAPAQPWTTAWLWWPASHGHPGSHLFCADRELWDSVPASSWGCCQGLSFSLSLKGRMACNSQPSCAPHWPKPLPALLPGARAGPPTRRPRCDGPHSPRPRRLLGGRQHGWVGAHQLFFFFNGGKIHNMKLTTI